MCGRYGLAAPADELVEAFDVPGLTFDYQPRYNVSPGTSCVVVAEDGRGRRAGLMRWGFPVVRRGGEGGNPAGRPVINARAETVSTKSSFREAFRHRRCLVPADGFFEWGGGRAAARRPHWFSPAQGGLISLAAIWAPEGFAILTTRANREVASVHHRMPLLIRPADRARWLDRRAGTDDVRHLTTAVHDGILTSVPVSTRVNPTSEDDRQLRDPQETGTRSRSS